VTPYGSSPQWPPSVPLSSYSSLNGATTNTNGQTASPHQMVIELSVSNDSCKPLSDTHLSSPALTMGTPPTSSTTQPYALSARSPYQQYHSPTMAINPAFVHSFSPPQQNAQSPPQTLAPYALHAPSTPVETISPAAFYQQTTPSTSATPPSNTPTPTPNKLTPQARQEKFNSTVKSLLQPNQFTGAGAVSDLADRIIALDVTEVEGPLRLEILTKIRDNAGNHYFRAWVENEDAMDITREWLKAAAKGDDQLVETIMPLLHVRRSFIIPMMDIPECRNRQIIDRLPWSLETLRKAKLGKIILKLTKEASIPGKHPNISPCLRNCDLVAWLTLLSPARCICTFPHIVRKETNEPESNNFFSLSLSPRSGQGHGIKSRA
jgi:protein phosphatase 1 regulatory subunit 10